MTERIAVSLRGCQKGDILKAGLHKQWLVVIQTILHLSNIVPQVQASLTGL